MTQPQIQAFLDQNIGACTNGLCLNVLRATTFDRPADRTVCGSYAGAANELTSAIIFKVQVACGVSAKVLLVTLQKEQSLVSGGVSQAPSAARIGRAMGYACPDNTGGTCDARYYGIYNQLYSAAWQFKRYSTPDLWGNYHPGPETIAYSPNAACGARAVTIRNNATAALYNYTPYTPNAAALANLYGTAACGAYGNRNFWVFYSQWFGDPTDSTAAYDMGTLYQANGGASGAFGTLVSESGCLVDSPSCWRNYQFAFVYWTKALGAVATTGALLAAYRTTGGPTGSLGLPSTSVVTYTRAPLKVAQSFGSAATIYSSSLGTFVVRGAVRVAYFNAGGEGGTFGWPASTEACAVTGCTQVFEGGTVYPSAAGALAVPKVIDIVYRAAGGPSGSLGNPSSVIFLYPSLPGRLAQAFAGGGSIYASSSGVFAVSAPIRSSYFAAGGEGGSLGWPVGAMVCVSANCSQEFEFGSVHSSSKGSFVVPAAINATYLSAGGASGSLGRPSSAVFLYPALPGRMAQPFGSGSIYASPAGSFVVQGAMRTGYFAAGGEGGALGWPVAAQTCDGATGNCSQKFEGGAVYSTPSGTVSIRSGIDVAYAALGGPWGSLGFPTSAVFLYPSLLGRVAQEFGGASIYASPAGSFVVQGAMRTGYFAAGGERGALGWPIAAEVCDGATTNCWQKFEGGAVYSSPSGTVAVRSGIDLAYAASGGPWGSLGYPTSAIFLYPLLPGRVAQEFGSASIYASPAGSFVVEGAMRTAYFVAGGERGALGWPIATQVCDGVTGICSQKFEGGTVTTP